MLQAPDIGRAPASQALDFDSLAHLYRPGLFRYALAFLRDRDAANSIAQDCLLRAWQSLPNFRGDASLKTWLMRIAVNLVRDHARNRRLQFWKRTRAESTRPLESYIDAGHDAQSPERKAILNQQVQAIWIRAGLLPPRQKTVFLLRFVEDMDILEIAAATGMKEGTVKTHLSRALLTIRAALKAQS